MKLSAAHKLKWLTSEKLGGLNIDHKGFQEVIIYLKQETVAAFTWFPATPLSEDLVSRLEARFAVENSGSLHMVAPAWMKDSIDIFQTRLDALKISIQFSSFFWLRAEDQKLNLRVGLNVINVDDSPVILKMLKQCLPDSEGFHVTNQISDSNTAAKEIQASGADIATVDIQMPGKNGVQVTAEVMKKQALPIIIISALGLDEGELVYQALEAGAFDYLQKPALEHMASFKLTLQQKLLAAVRGFEAQQHNRSISSLLRRPSTGFLFDNNMIWCLGASTGGTQALTQLLTSLPKEIPPTLIVQHMPAVFSKAFANSLNKLCPFEVVEASEGDEIRKNCVYIAPGGTQMSVSGARGKLKIRISDDAPVNRFKPSVDYLFDSVSKTEGLRIVAGLLTGMGKDGAQGLLSLRKRGAETFAQDESTSVVFGMPRAAIELGAAKAILPLEEAAKHMMKVSASNSDQKTG